jgi:hypothetical protein
VTRWADDGETVYVPASSADLQPYAESQRGNVLAQALRGGTQRFPAPQLAAESAPDADAPRTIRSSDLEVPFPLVRRFVRVLGVKVPLTVQAQSNRGPDPLDRCGEDGFW